MNSPEPLTKGAVETQLAKKWGCSNRTIRQWRQEGAPLGDEAAMKPWLLSRHKVPPGTWAILKGQKSIALEKPKRRIVPTGNEAPSGEPGAAAALGRLQTQEVESHDRYVALIRDASATAEEIEDARKAYLAIVGTLRQWELAVEQDRRQSGELLPRTDLDAFCRLFLVHFVGSLKAGLESLCPRLAGLDAPGSVWQVLGPSFDRAVDESLRNVATRPFAGHSCPEWLTKAIQDARSANL